MARELTDIERLAIELDRRGRYEELVLELAETSGRCFLLECENARLEALVRAGPALAKEALLRYPVARRGRRGPEAGHRLSRLGLALREVLVKAARVLRGMYEMMGAGNQK